MCKNSVPWCVMELSLLEVLYENVTIFIFGSPSTVYACNHQQFNIYLYCISISDDGWVNVEFGFDFAKQSIVAFMPYRTNVLFFSLTIRKKQIKWRVIISKLRTLHYNYRSDLFKSQCWFMRFLRFLHPYLIVVWNIKW